MAEEDTMSKKTHYSIGELSQICNVSKKALRFYDEKGLISSLRHDCNNYRVYTHDEMLNVLVLKYYKQMGFKLDEMKDFLTGNSANIPNFMGEAFDRKLAEIQKEQVALRRSEESLRDWRGLLHEAELVIAKGVTEVSVRYVPQEEFLFQEQPFDGDIKSAIINARFMDYVEKTGNAITGPVHIHFSSMKSRMEGESQPVRILQKTLPPHSEAGRTSFGGCMMASCYHIGDIEKIQETYERFISWIGRHGYTADEDCFERYVTDYWTTSNSTGHVTELLVKVDRPTALR